ncbi:uncharacterized protein LOC121529269 isoform X2 [Cheilinus undulatus]|nr:uncharacterized protein LOC121529269 isoform X2 [Cheilinus undulatus]XP_041673000.1 uncharacterized protein LOC121529269 isoform X2 [Cheilinus undulatus]
MSTADQLLEQMYSWMKQREECAEKLRKLAKELESIREKSNGFQAIGSSLSVVGSVCLVGAGVATLFTGGLAAPFLGVVGGVYTGVGLSMSLITMFVEHLSSSDTMNQAKSIEEKCNELTKNIQRLYDQLKQELQQEATFKDADDLEYRIMSEIMGAMARRSGWSVPTQTLFMSQGQTYLSHRRRSIITDPNQMTGIAGVLAFFSLTANGKGAQFLFAKGREQLLKKVIKAGLKTTFKGGAKVAGGVIGLAFSLPDAVDHWKDLVKGNKETEASKSLRDTADDLEKISRTLKKQLENIMQEYRQILKDFETLKLCIENSSRTSKERREFIEIAKKYFGTDSAVYKWVEENETEFFKLIDLFKFMKEEIEKQQPNIDHKIIDVIFVAHGSIGDPAVNQPSRARDLLPLPSIQDVILYSPWNSAIDSNIAYGITTGHLQPEDRDFCCGCQCGKDCDGDCECGCGCCCRDHKKHQPTRLPPDWNSMRDAGDSLIPNITVSPLEKPEDPAWNEVLILQDKYSRPGRNRVVVPYNILEPEGQSMDVPFSVVTLALALVLRVFGYKATVHLAACLGREPGTLSRQARPLNRQYAWAIDGTAMTCNEDMVDESEELSQLLEFLRKIFDR